MKLRQRLAGWLLDASEWARDKAFDFAGGSEPPPKKDKEAEGFTQVPLPKGPVGDGVMLTDASRAMLEPRKPVLKVVEDEPLEGSIEARMAAVRRP